MVDLHVCLSFGFCIFPFHFQRSRSSQPFTFRFQSSEHLGGAAGGEEQTPATETHGPVNDSDTGAADNEVKDGKGKKKKERTRKRTHLGPRIKVYITNY